MKKLDAAIGAMDFRSSKRIGTQVRALRLTERTVGEAVRVAQARSPRKGLLVARGILATSVTKAKYEQNSLALIDWARRAGAKQRRLITQAVLQDGGKAAQLYLVHRISEMKRSAARAFMKEYFRAGGEVEAVAQWLRAAGKVLRRRRRKAQGSAGDVLEGAADWVVDKLEDGVDAIMENLEAIVDAVVSAGVAMARVVKAAASWSVQQLRDLFTALLEAAVTVAEIVAPMLKMAYATVAKFVSALIDAGVTALELVQQVVTKSYWALRRILHGLVQKLGVADALNAVRQLVAGAVDALWVRALKAIRYTLHELKEDLGAVVRWAASVGVVAVEAMLRAWETIREPLEDFLRFALTLARGVWRHIGEATQRIGNSVHYVLEFVKEDLIPAVFQVVRGALQAGFAVVSLMAWAVGQAYEVVVEVVRGALAVGTTLAVLIRDTLENPASALDNVIRAARSIGKTLVDVYRATIVDTAQEFIEQVTLSLYRIGQGVKKILGAVLEVAGGALATVISILLNTLGSYRPMMGREIADARIVFGETLDYGRIYLATEGPVNDIIFGIQDFLSKNPESRAFTTDTLINFDAREGIDRPTLIHELTHVWQAEETGSFYMAEAIYAQATAGYNYGYEEGTGTVTIVVDYEGTTKAVDQGALTGEGAQSELAAADGDFEAFNREQQGQIMMHYFVRKKLLGQRAAELAPWQPYVDYVQAAA